MDGNYRRDVGREWIAMHYSLMNDDASGRVEYTGNTRRC